jgi:uncharacterized protein involved in type VI secretion and phage assembly
MFDRDPEKLSIEQERRQRARHYGKYRGTVSEIGTGERLGFIRARVPAVYGKDLASTWAAPAVPLAGDACGWLSLPKVDDGVWIEFEGGDCDLPIWTGFWWAGNDRKPPGASPECRVLASPKGHRLVLDDDRGVLLFKHADGPEILLEKGSIRIQFDAQKKIVIDQSGVHINGTALEVK